ncbi:MAG: hypothetical protein Fur0037_08660 [Planctomycetota bacterium]
MRRSRGPLPFRLRRRIAPLLLLATGSCGLFADEFMTFDARPVKAAGAADGTAAAPPVPAERPTPVAMIPCPSRIRLVPETRGPSEIRAPAGGARD